MKIYIIALLILFGIGLLSDLCKLTTTSDWPITKEKTLGNHLAGMFIILILIITGVIALLIP